MSISIRQADNYSGNFGLVLRSSAIFYYRRDEHLTSVISLMNYWKQKRGLDVLVVASVRDMGGALLGREQLTFDVGDVINFTPALAEGSVEIEVFSLQNMVIPYAAVMGIYESRRGIAMVHSYSRVYSNHEVEEGRTITHGEESCWTMSGHGRPFAVFHNGSAPAPAQEVVLTVTSEAGDTRSGVAPLAALRPYETVKLYADDHVDLSIAGGGTLFATASFRTVNSFTRMMVGEETADDFQVSHSDFNYSKHDTDHVTGSGYLLPPKADRLDVVVYPGADPGEYRVNGRAFSSDKALVWPAPPERLEFEKVGGPFPSRLHAGIRLTGEGVLPAVLSFGVYHKERPAKRLWWGPVDRSSIVYVRELDDIYGSANGAPLSLRLFRPDTHQVKEVSVAPSALEGIRPADVFGEIPAYSWMTCYSDFGGYVVFSTLQRGESRTLEHWF